MKKISEEQALQGWTTYMYLPQCNCSCLGPLGFVGRDGTQAVPSDGQEFSSTIEVYMIYSYAITNLFKLRFRFGQFTNVLLNSTLITLARGTKELRGPTYPHWVPVANVLWPWHMVTKVKLISPNSVCLLCQHLQPTYSSVSAFVLTEEKQSNSLIWSNWF